MNAMHPRVNVSKHGVGKHLYSMMMTLFLTFLAVLYSFSVGTCSILLREDAKDDLTKVVVFNQEDISREGSPRARNQQTPNATAMEMVVITTDADNRPENKSTCGQGKNHTDSRELVSGCKYTFIASDQDEMARSYMYGWVAIKNITKESQSCVFEYECDFVMLQDTSHLCNWRVEKGKGDDNFYVPIFPETNILFDRYKICKAKAWHQENYVGACFPKWDRFGNRYLAENQIIPGSNEDRVPMGRLSWFNPVWDTQKTSCVLSITNKNRNGHVAVLIPDTVKYIEITDGKSGSSLSPLYKHSSVVISSSNQIKMTFTDEYNKKMFNAFYNYFRFSYLFLPGDYKSSTNYVLPTITNCGQATSMLDFEHSLTISINGISSDEIYDCVWLIPLNGSKLHIHFEEFDFGNKTIRNPHLFSDPVYDEWSQDSFMTLIAYRSGDNGSMFLGKFDASNTTPNTSIFLSPPDDSVALYLRLRSVKLDAVGFRIIMNLYHTGNGSVTDVETVLRCNNGVYVDSSTVCDGHNHCGDNSDENAELCDSQRSRPNNCTRLESGCLMLDPADSHVVRKTPCCSFNPYTEPCMFPNLKDPSQAGACCPKMGTNVVCDYIPDPNIWEKNINWFIIGGTVMFVIFFVIVVLIWLRRRGMIRIYERIPGDSVPASEASGSEEEITAYSRPYLSGLPPDIH